MMKCAKINITTVAGAADAVWEIIEILVNNAKPILFFRNFNMEQGCNKKSFMALKLRYS
jgi:hypothetical protein